MVGHGPSLVRVATLTRSLIPNFSYLSEVGASFLDDRLGLGLVPKTRLVGFSSPSFHYLYKDRHRWEQGWQPLPIKIGSLQQFLEGYENAGRFLQKHALPGRSKDVMERDLREEHRAHRLSRRKQGARLRMAFIALKRLLLCRYGPGPYGSTDTNDNASPPKKPPSFTEEASAYPAAAPMSVSGEDGFEWTEEVFTDMRLELEKLVLLDFLMRNTDRGLDNFMIRYNPHPRPGERRITIGAIDNSLSFPHQHPQGLRDYPYGWLYLPTGLIGLPFSDETRQLFLPKLTDPIWWAGTIEGLRRIFSQDAHFHERTFQNQMSLLMGQGWLIVQCLRQKSEGPIELCARPKFVVRSSVQMLSHAQLAKLTVTDLVQGTTSFSKARRDIANDHKDNTRSARASAINVKPNRQSRAHLVTQSMPSVLRSPKSPSFPFSPSSNARGIDIVERMAMEQKSHKMVTTATPAPYDSPREPPSSKASRRMPPLDLAVGTSVYPLPVLVETVEPVRRRTPFSFN